jgi:hypothetical protein
MAKLHLLRILRQRGLLFLRPRKCWGILLRSTVSAYCVGYVRRTDDHRVDTGVSISTLSLHRLLHEGMVPVSGCNTRLVLLRVVVKCLFIYLCMLYVCCIMHVVALGMSCHMCHDGCLRLGGTNVYSAKNGPNTSVVPYNRCRFTAPPKQNTEEIMRQMKAAIKQTDKCLVDAYDKVVPKKVERQAPRRWQRSSDTEASSQRHTKVRRRVEATGHTFTPALKRKLDKETYKQTRRNVRQHYKGICREAKDASMSGQIGAVYTAIRRIPKDGHDSHTNITCSEYLVCSLSLFHSEILQHCGKVVAQLTVRTAGCNGAMPPFKAHIDHKLSYPTYIIGSDRQ